MGFLMGALFLSFYVDPGLQPEGFTEQDSGWVGAWWVGFLLCSLLAFVSALPLLTFPPQLQRRFSTSPHGACQDTVMTVEQPNEDFTMGDLGEGFKGEEDISTHSVLQGFCEGRPCGAPPDLVAPPKFCFKI
jgi:hypothetical protein